MGEKRGAYSDLVGRSEDKRPLGTPRHSWEDNIKTNFKETVWEGASHHDSFTPVSIERVGPRAGLDALENR
jgi:hypothetical protein